MDSNTASAVAASASAVAASVSTLVAVAALYVQGRRARALLRIELLFKFNDRFNSQAFRDVRSSAASAVLRDADDFADVDEVLDFFESIGLMMHRKVLDPEMIWSEFFYWIDGWWCAAQDRIQEVRADDDLTWDYFRYLREEVIGIERKLTMAKDSDLVQSREDIVAFLEGEEAPVNRARPKSRLSTTKKKAARSRDEKKPSESASSET